MLMTEKHRMTYTNDVENARLEERNAIGLVDVHEVGHVLGKQNGLLDEHVDVVEETRVREQAE